MPQRAQKTLPSTPGPSTASGSGSGGAHGGGGSGHGHGTPAPDEAPLIAAPGTYGIADVIVGCKIFVEKPDLATAEVEQRLAEILSVRERPKPRRLGAGAAAARAEDEARPAEEKLEYYVHYAEFNKRLDEWVSGKRLIFTREMTWPKPVAPAAPPGTGTGRKKTARPSVSGTPGTPGTPSAAPSRTASSNLLKKAAMAAASQTQESLDGSSSVATPGPLRAAASAPSPQTPSRGSSSPAPMTPGADGDVEMDDGDTTHGGVGEHAAVVTVEMVGETSEANAEEAGEAASVNRELHPNARPGVKQPGTFSKAAEIEKLRTSGSMTQSVHEVSRVKNLNRIQMGSHEIETWYFSPYPIEFAHVDTLYVCEMCLCYFPTAFIMARHRKKCGIVHPPGNEIYRHEDISFFEIDGRRQKTWCRNLCLLSKCFLDHKSVYYDVDPFLYYVMAQRDDAGAHIIGYFSKEKESAENYNVACILTLPQHQRAGFGKLLIEFSYELTKREHKLGSPEKPLSDLGLLGYRAYWAETIVELLLRTEEEISIDEIANRTAIVHADILHTCTALNMLKHYQGKHYLVLNDIVLQNHEKQMKKKRRRIVPERLNWEPPRFTREQLRFGF